MLDPILRKIRKNLKHQNLIIGKEEKYFNAAVLIPLIEINHEVHLLFQIRSESIRQGGEIGFPGGMKEDEDLGDYEKTAVRETCEELGVQEDQIKVIGHLGTLVAHSGVTIDVYTGILDIKDLSELTLNEEVASVFTIPLNVLEDIEPEIHYVRMEVQPSFVDEEDNQIILIPSKSLGLPDKYDKPWGMRKRKVYFYRYEDHIIWGMTGEITYTFLQLLG